jgi:hypothetical protein
MTVDTASQMAFFNIKTFSAAWMTFDRFAF